MKRIPVLAAAVLLATVAAPPVHAAAADQGYCHVDTLLESPEGISMEPRSGTFTSAGSATCFGSPNGVQATGPGTYTSYGTFDGTCAQLAGTFTYLITLPTAQGEATITDSGDFQYAHFIVGNGLGTFGFAPEEGNCVTEPLKAMRVFGQLVITG